jgi:hypothetical protein
MPFVSPDRSQFWVVVMNKVIFVEFPIAKDAPDH